jgi:hypothetical protein
VTDVTEVLEPDPVFVDHTGRRRRLIRGAGLAVGVVLVAYLGVLVVGLVSGSGAPLTPWPAAKPSAPAGHRGSAARPDRSRPTVTGPAAVVAPGTPSGRPDSDAQRATTAPATASPTATRPGKGRGHWLTKSPQHPKRS